jgi:hypothetical protein
MVDVVAVVFLVAPGDVSSPTAVAMAGAARETLGALVEVRESPTVPTDGDALAAEASAHASAVAEVLWEDPGHRRARLRIHLARSQGWVERSVTFSPTDPAAERGRMLGFAVALVIPERPEERSGDPAAPPGPATPGAASPSPTTPPPVTTPPSSTTMPSPASTPSASTSPSPASAPPGQTPPPGPASPPSRGPMPGAASPQIPVGPAAGESGADDGERAPSGARRRGGPKVAVDLLFAGTAWIGGKATGAGGAAGVHWFPLPLLSVRLGAAEKTGSLNAAEASFFTVGMTAGLALHPFEMSVDRPFGLTVRADYLLVRESVSHFDADDPAPVTHVRWLSGFDVVVEVGWQLTSEIGLVAGLGLEDVLAPTYIDVRGAQVETIPALRGVAEAGFCLRF